MTERLKFEGGSTEGERPRGLRGVFWRVRWYAAYASYWAAAKLHTIGFAFDPRPSEDDDDGGSGGNYL